METVAAVKTEQTQPSRRGLSPRSAMILALWVGLCAGYVDLGIIVAKRFTLNPEASYRAARDFPWTVPVGHMVLAIVPGLAVAAIGMARRGRGVSLRVAAWFLATMALWFAFLRLPFHWSASLMLAFGIGLVWSDVVAWAGFSPRLGWVRKSSALLVGALLVLAAFSTGRRVLGESRGVAALPPAAKGAKNVVFIVLDTVRASNMSLYGYQRDTTPNLVRWAKKGVTYNRAIAPAPWTFPSHATFFTGRWPMEIDTQWKYALETPDPTLAEFLVTKGYQTAGFAANTNCCNYETGLDRGFLHFEDYSLTPRALLDRTVPGKWLLEKTFMLANPYERKWVSLQSRGAADVNGALLRWMDQRRSDRPFLAFVNYFDAHEPFIPPSSLPNHMGIKPKTRRDFQYLVDYVGADKTLISERDFQMTIDCYDDCISWLDLQVGRLLDELERREMLEDTVVVITSDHGEAFAEHGLCGHAYSVNVEEIGVPLLILAPKAPAGRVVYDSISLRDLSATMIDLLGHSAKSPFPGRSLASLWTTPPGKEPAESTSPVFAEQASALAFAAEPANDRGRRGYEMSVIGLGGRQYIRNAQGQEQLYDLWRDPQARLNLISAPQLAPTAWRLRAMMLKILNDNPGSATVENAYMKTFRDDLTALLRTQPRTPLEAPPAEN
jgi:arylsulfatase A-like enzyme